jgi:hypothetical protein
MTKKITAYKGFDKDWKCRDFKFEVGKSYEAEGKIEACTNGFHACESPLDVFGYYPPGTSRFAVVELFGETAKETGGDSKVAAAKITVTAELALPEFLSKAVEFIIAKAKKSKTETGYQSAASNTGNRSAASNTGYQSAASNTGNRSAASNTGDYSAASNTGDYSAASNTGYQSAASNTGNRSAASNTGDYSAASVEGENAIAVAHGLGSKAKASKGSALVVSEFDDEGILIKIHSGIAGKTKGVKPGTWYRAEKGKLVEVKS